MADTKNAAFTQRHFNAVAKVLREFRHDLMVTSVGSGKYRTLEDVIDGVTVALATYFSEDNPRFDAELFLRRATRSPQEDEGSMGNPV